MSSPLFPISVNNVKNKFLTYVILRDSTRIVNEILNRHPEIQTRLHLYNYLHQLPANSYEFIAFENAYDEFIAYENV
jgi:hypothetical protein